MGFATSGSAVVILIGLLVATATLFPALESALERTSDARDEISDRRLDRRNTDATVTNVTYDAGPDRLEVSVRNDGSRTLRVDRTDLLLDGQYTGFNATVAGEARDVWVSGETAVLTAEPVTPEPGRVKVVVGTGVARTTEVA